MKLSASVILLALGHSACGAFIPSTGIGSRASSRSFSPVVLNGYLDDLSKDLYKEKEEEYNPDTDSREATAMNRDEIDRYGPGNLKNFVDFEEFDGGDGQMGVAGDGNKGLEKIGSQPTLAKSMEKSRMMSAKNAWGTSTGYADELREKNPEMDTARAQQLENWKNQREVYAKNQWVKKMEEADAVNREDVNWRELAKFGVERTQEFDLNEAFGAVVAGELEGVIEMKSMIGRPTTFTIPLKNQFMGFADFRAAFTPESSFDFQVDPTEGSLMQREPVMFNIRFTPSNPGVTEGMLVIETEDFKKTWKLIGSTS